MLMRTLRDLTPAEVMVAVSLLVIVLSASLGWR